MLIEIRKTKPINHTALPCKRIWPKPTDGASPKCACRLSADADAETADKARFTSAAAAFLSTTDTRSCAPARRGEDRVIRPPARSGLSSAAVIAHFTGAISSLGAVFNCRRRFAEYRHDHPVYKRCVFFFPLHGQDGDHNRPDKTMPSPAPAPGSGPGRPARSRRSRRGSFSPRPRRWSKPPRTKLTGEKVYFIGRSRARRNLESSCL